VRRGLVPPPQTPRSGDFIVFEKLRTAFTGRAILTNDAGATLVEYAMIVSLVAAVCIGVLGAFGIDLQSMFTAISSGVGDA